MISQSFQSLQDRPKGRSWPTWTDFNRSSSKKRRSKKVLTRSLSKIKTISRLISLRTHSSRSESVLPRSSLTRKCWSEKTTCRCKLNRLRTTCLLWKTQGRCMFKTLKKERGRRKPSRGGGPRKATGSTQTPTAKTRQPSPRKVVAHVRLLSLLRSTTSIRGVKPHLESRSISHLFKKLDIEQPSQTKAISRNSLEIPINRPKERVTSSKQANWSLSVTFNSIQGCLIKDISKKPSIHSIKLSASAKR